MKITVFSCFADGKVYAFGPPVDKFGMLVPYIVLALTIMVATVATADYVKRRKKKQ